MGIKTRSTFEKKRTSRSWHTHIALVAAAAALLGCAARASTVRGAADTFSDEQRLSACLDLRDHVVELYADDYLTTNRFEGTSLEHAQFRAQWGEELAKRGTFERFEASCFSSLTPPKFRCGMTSATPDALVACMKLSDAR